MATDKLANASVPGPIVIAHRGASGRRPEHTLAAYELAIVQGADFIELDLVATADGALVARHENALAVAAVDETGALVLDASGRPVVVEATTDVAEHAAFADRLTVKQVDGRPIGGWFSEDFTLAELARLRARERVPDIRPANRVYDDAESIPTLAQVIDLVRAMETRGAGRAGLYVELKHPTYFATEGRRLDGSPIAVDLVGLLLEALSEAGFVAGDRLFVQCFEVAPLIEFEDRQTARGWDIPLIQLFGDVDNRSYRAAPWDMVSRARRADTAVYGVLATLIRGGITEGVSYADLAAPEVLAHLRQRYAAGIGPPRQNVLLTVPGPDGGPDLFTGTPSPLLGHARQLGLLVHPYTLRAEAPFLLERQGRLVTVQEEALALLDAGVDGFFIDQPDEGRLAVLRHRTALERSPPL